MQLLLFFHPLIQNLLLQIWDFTNFGIKLALNLKISAWTKLSETLVFYNSLKANCLFKLKLVLQLIHHFFSVKKI